jgi:hypothetical protein
LVLMLKLHSDYELTRRVSLSSHNLLALKTFRATGSCTTSIPELLYDRDYPGHYMRRIKSVSLSIRTVVGPYATVRVKLYLKSSSVRISPELRSGVYARDTVNGDPRFIDYFEPVETVVTSDGTGDSGLFAGNVNDERYFPFSGAGAISVWSVSLPTDFAAFDYSTISDVILRIDYTAQDGGEPLKDQVIRESKKAGPEGP